MSRPSTFPNKTNLKTFQIRVPYKTVRQLKELSRKRDNYFGLDHNSMAAEFTRIVENAFKEFKRKKK